MKLDDNWNETTSWTVFSGFSSAHFYDAPGVNGEFGIGFNYSPYTHLVFKDNQKSWSYSF